ncbi:MAG: ATP-dependent helicase HrpB [Kiritimatiellaeota bacterium]|nr:ATP-dependent helicase HrpB [Kiritimatiellota bacterium]
MIIDNSTLPICSALPALREALARARGSVLTAPPGSGKTTFVPLALLDEPFLAGKKIIMLEPRRVAARAAAWRMSDMLGETCGKTVGYMTRFEREISASTRVIVLTEGLFTRRILDDPELSNCGLVIFDEFHERSLNADFGLALALDCQRALRPDLRILVMSATLDTAPIARHIGNAPVISAEGKMFPVETVFCPQPRERRLSDSVASVVRRSLAETDGSILAFLPGEGEIKSACELLRDVSADIDILPLYAALPKHEQDRVLRPSPQGRRKVALATSIAESSLTIDGISAVVDCGFARVSQFSPESGMSRLVTVRITRDRADQRRGRAGRLRPGVCYRLWQREDDATLDSSAPPEILTADLAPLVLQTADWGRADASTLDWLTPPPSAAWKQAVELLRELGALDKNLSPTKHGRDMARFGVHPRLSHPLAWGQSAPAAPQFLETAALIAAALSENVVYRESNNISHLLAEIENPRGAISPGARQRIKELAKSLEGVAAALCAARRCKGTVSGYTPPPQIGVGAILAMAFPDRVAKRRPLATDTGRYLLSCGRGAMLRDNDPLAASDWICAAELDDSAGGEARIRLAAPLTFAEVEELFSDLFVKADLFEWNERTKRVDALERTTFGAITVRERPERDPDPERVLKCLCDGIRREGIDKLNWTPAALNLRARINVAQTRMSVRDESVKNPHTGKNVCATFYTDKNVCATFSDESIAANLEQILGPFLFGKTSLKEAAECDLHNALLTALGSDAARQLDALAPTHLKVPSGSEIRIDYTGDQPAASVRIQECFGMKTTPKVCGGKIPVLLKLLSPAQRPVQITADLESFWKNGYAEVRKDLRGRYPKHYWPEDPTTAIPTRRLARNVPSHTDN